MSITDRGSVLAQYRDASNLDARVRLHEQFSTNRYGWHQWIFDQLEPAPNQRVLEVGCGSGHLWRRNLGRVPNGWEITLTDLSEGMLAEARRNLGENRRFRFTIADAQQLPFDASRFDAVIANHMLYHVPDRGRALAEIRRVLRPGGRFYASTIGRTNLRELEELIARFAPTWVPWSRAIGGPDAFCLENGAAPISRHFPRVELRRYADALVVTEAAPLLAYVLSGSARSSLDDAAVRDLANYVDAQIAERGEIRIRKDSGLFVASDAPA